MKLPFMNKPEPVSTTVAVNNRLVLEIFDGADYGQEFGTGIAFIESSPTWPVRCKCCKKFRNGGFESFLDDGHSRFYCKNCTDLMIMEKDIAWEL